MLKIKFLAILLFVNSLVNAQDFKRLEFYFHKNWTVDSLNFHKKDLYQKYKVQAKFSNVITFKNKWVKSFDMVIIGKNRKGQASFSGDEKGYKFGFIIDNSFFSRQAFVIGYIKD